jgi:hypothetical protein
MAQISVSFACEQRTLADASAGRPDVAAEITVVAAVSPASRAAPAPRSRC